MEITANAIQTVTPGSNVLFTETAVGGGPSIFHREGSGLVTLRGITNQSRARFRVTFGGNVATPPDLQATDLIMAIAINGEGVATTNMMAPSFAAGRYFNIFSSIFLDIPAGCCSQISVKNIGSTSVNVQNANLIVERVA